ncbi:regulator of chromosome condensation 1/beta-lactamase-inhibitor protein II [Lophiotrema nucula]|uniref:Regulator of chromosome condensation 1/beta-lactamase-inhibitor protein II n=1 Tax=Lophiotrema nucula TaxID=690887 RepID=A0A6A5ZAL6_9PLEO|nr:regulator of chromosome condensation 1/beta-lactamase-inhibitor protein II [Lophiotrema nucula]
MDAYVFGYNGRGQLSKVAPHSSTQPQRNNIPIPSKSSSNGGIDIIWASWCDALVATTDPVTGNAQPKLEYFGEGLARSQIAHVTSIKNPLASKFFGGKFAAGLRGILEPSGESEQSVTIFGSPETHSPELEIETFTIGGPCKIQHVVILSNDSLTVVVSMLLSSNTDTRITEAESSNNYVLSFANLAEFKTWLQTDTPTVPLEAASRPYPRFTDFVTNATTLTALDIDGRVWTWTHDSRYPKTLGRPVDAQAPSNIPSQVPYLSETKISKIASGGYMTAALSSDGELYLWGQACPSPDGTAHQLSIFKDYDPSDARKYPNVTEDGLYIPDTGFDLDLPPPPMAYQPWSPQNAQRWARDVAIMRRDGRLPRHPQDPRPLRGEDQDEFVKCVPVRVNGMEGTATDVAVGHGHVLVSAEARPPGMPAHFVMRSVLGMGQGEKGQLGVAANSNGQSQSSSSIPPDFVEELRQVQTLTPNVLRERKVKAMKCAGWSSWVVVEAQRV